MRAFIMVALISVVVTACSREKTKETTVPSSTAAPMSAIRTAAIRDVAVDLSGEAGGSRCQVNAVRKAFAHPDDVVRWSFTVKTAECKQRKVKVHKKADEIDCSSGVVIQKNVPLPVEDCEREDQNTGDVGSTIRLTCPIPADFDGRRCFKYTIGGQVINGDPEIEIERPRLDGPSPESTPSPTPTP